MENEQKVTQKMSVLLLCNDKVSGATYKKSIYDQQAFTSVNSVEYSAVKEKLHKGAHGIVAMITDQAKIEEAALVMEKYSKYEIRVLVAGNPDIKEQLATKFADQGWNLFQESQHADIKLFLKERFTT